MGTSAIKKKKEPSLRKKAEQALKKQAGRLDELSKQDMKSLIHELGTHQIELEMQNDELRRAQQELETSRRKYADLYSLAPVGYFSLDGKSRIREMNFAGADLLGEKKQRLLNVPFSRFVLDEELKTFLDHLSETSEKHTKTVCELRLRKTDGTEFYAHLQSVADEDDEGQALIRTAISDVTSHKLLEKALKQANDELEAVNKELDAFSFAVANDLKAPIRSIEGFTRIILEHYAPLLDGTGQDYLRRVRSASQRMGQLIDAMYAMARTTRGELREKNVDLSMLAQVIIDKLRKQEPGRKVDVVIAGGLKTRGDQAMLLAALENLLDNAWKFTSRHERARIEFGTCSLGNADCPGSGESAGTCGMRNVKSKLQTPGSELVYFVRDDGAGFDARYADKLFQPFRRLHKEEDFPGIGIGLAIANHIIKRHGGRMWAEGEVEKGATFYFTVGSQ